MIGAYVYVADLGGGPGGTAIVPPSMRSRPAQVWHFNDGKYSTVIAADGRLIVAGVSPPVRTSRRGPHRRIRAVPAGGQ